MSMDKRSIEKAVNDLLVKLSLEEKISLCHAATKFTVAAVPRVGIPSLSLSDGPHGVRQEIAADSWDPLDCDTDFATYQPTGTALAATWNRDCARRFGEVLGAEARERGKDIILGPGINVIRTPLCGRNFEYYSEDPCLIAEMVVPAIEGIQSQDTAACVKHYALNNQELNRGRVNVVADERTLREIYLPGFEAAVKQGKTLSLMGSYNQFRGQHCCHNDYLLNTVLKGEWNFDGVVISDWSGAHNTPESAGCGLDLEMGTEKPYPQYFLADAFRDAVKNGEIAQEVLDDKVRRILRLMFKIGKFDAKRQPGSRNTPDHQKAALATAEEAIVLLKNNGKILPLERQKLRTLLVVGDNAVRKHHAGGNSSAVKALYEVTPLEGIRKLLGDQVAVQFIPGYPDTGDAGIPVPTELLAPAESGAGSRGWTACFYANRDFTGKPAAVKTLADAAFDFTAELPAGLDPKNFTCRLSAVLTPVKNETWTLVLSDCHHVGLTIDGNWTIVRWETEGVPTQTAEVTLTAGKTYRLSLEIRPHLHRAAAPCRLKVITPDTPVVNTGRDELLEAAKHADAVLFFGGLNHLYDVEGSDRKDMKLHDGQNELISQLAAVNPHLVVTLVSGSPVEMPWIEQVPAVVEMWYAGMEAGTAIAKILFGDVNPSGKLPFTFPKQLSDSPAHRLDDYAADVEYYREGVFVGYRWFDAQKIEPLFPFGHGLSYTEFQYTDLSITMLDADENNAVAKAAVTLANIGSHAGMEVIQLYLGDDRCSVPRPPKELKGFAKVYLEPGEEKTIDFFISERDLSFFHPTLREWTLEEGDFTVQIGSSSRDIRLKGKFSLE